MKFYHEWREAEIKDLNDYVAKRIKELDAKEHDYNMVYDLAEELAIEGYRSSYSYTRLDVWPEKVEEVPFIIELINDFMDDHDIEIAEDNFWTFNDAGGWWTLIAPFARIEVNVNSICKQVVVGKKIIEETKYICGGE
jgi:hypothetical protein